MQHVVLYLILIFLSKTIIAQNRQDTLAIQKAALGYIEPQHNPNASQMQQSLHTGMVKRTFWKDAGTGKDYVRETTYESMLLLAESYNRKGDKFPPKPMKELLFLDVSQKTASVKLIADEWIDYMHLVKLNDEWKIINVLWQYKNVWKH